MSHGAESFRFGKVIGEGSFSTVYLAKEIKSGKEYAIKVCEKATIIKEHKQDYVKREKVALTLLNSSPGIINLASTFQDRTKLFFVLSYAANGELLKYITKPGSISMECVKFYAAELLLAIEDMHRLRVVHRDLKPENLLLSREMHLMVADFGSSRILPEDYDYEKAQAEIEQRELEEQEDEDDETTEGPRSSSKKRKASFVGTAQYVSPEVLKGKAACFGSDLWSLGCIIYQMIYGQPPFRGPSEYLIFQKIVAGDYTFPEDFDPQAKDLVQKLLTYEPKERIGFSDDHETRYHSIRNHPFFEGTQWSKGLYTQTPPVMELPLDRSEENPKPNYVFTDDIEPGLGDRQLRRILQEEFETLRSDDLPSETSQERLLEEQRANHAWADFVEHEELILKFGFINKRKKGLFPRKRMLLLTSTPRLIYIDGSERIKKGEIPFDLSIKCEPKNFKLFLVHTPNRIYYLEDVTGGALEWCNAIMSAKNRLKAT